MPSRRPSRLRTIITKRLRRMLGPLLLAALSMLGFTLAELMGPWPLKIIFDQILLDKPLSSVLLPIEPLLKGDKTTALIWVSSGILLVALLRGVFSYTQIFLTSRIGFQLTYTLRRKLFIHLQRLSLTFHNKTKTGELLTKVTSDTTALKDVFAESMLMFASHILNVLGMLTVMFMLNWRLSSVVALILVVLCVALWVLFKKIKAASKRQRKREGLIISRMSERLAAISIVQAFGRENYEKERFMDESSRSLEDSIHAARLEAAATRMVELISAVGVWAVVIFGALAALHGSLEPGELLVFITYVSNMYRPLRNMAKLSTRFSKAMVSAERINDILETDPEIKDAPDAIGASDVQGEVAFEQVTFAYADGKPVLNNVSFVVPKGRTVALVGSSGSGKSTVASLILRLYDPSSGRIAIDGVDIKAFRRESLRNQIGIVLQGALLFGASIRENIAYGKPEATLEEIMAAAKAANAHDFIMRLEDGYDTVIGERGSTLSGGQRQRIAIARALIKDSPILILDEPMTGLDVDSEAQVQEALDRLMRDKTCLIITHDPAAAANADEVFVLHEGQIQQTDTSLPVESVLRGVN